MRAKVYFLPLLFIFFFVPQLLFSQTKKTKGLFKHEKANALVSLGTSMYYGDLCDKFECTVLRPSLGIGFIYRFTNHISNKTELNYYRLFAKDVWPDRNLGFRSGNVELYTSVMIDLFPYTRHYAKRKLISPYVFLGIGVTYFNPKGKNPTTGSWEALRPLQTEGVAYSPVTMIIPFGAGVKIKFHRNYDFMVEGGYRKTFTDYMDDVSSFHYKNLDNFANADAATMSMRADKTTNSPFSYASTYQYQQRGNPTKKDGYFIVSVKFRYIIGGAANNFKGKHPLIQPHHK